MKKILISNTGPIIALAGVNSLDLLRNLYSQILVPKAVDNEIKRCGHSRADILSPESLCPLNLFIARPVKFLPHEMLTMAALPCKISSGALKGHPQGFNWARPVTFRRTAQRI